MLPVKLVETQPVANKSSERETSVARIQVPFQRPIYAES